MKKVFYGLLALSLTFILVACGGNSDNGDTTPSTNDRIQVVATFSIIADMVHQIAGDLVDVYTIVPIGQNPEDHHILPSDMMAASNAHIIFYNGLNLETDGDWFANLMSSTSQVAGVDYFRVTAGITPLLLQTEGLEAYEDPHAWLNLLYGIAYVNNITSVLSDFSPEHAPIFQANAEAYTSKLLALHNEWIGRFDNIPDDERILVTSEGAFRYFAEVYGLNVAYIWELNAEEEGTPEQMIALINAVNASNVRSLFAESSIDDQYINQISTETGVEVFATIFTDSISEPSGPAPTYYEMMRFNLETIYAGLTR
ncbi:MAG: zinc ABC transporter substrate-binding protein [Defluviitaleaceae bacterium]|nr:zinc ABC transporter substrate-binding protein [Defluviitaleaceae bacterium]